MKGHEFKLRKSRNITRNMNARRKFVSQRVMDSWNALPAEIVRSETSADFIRRLATFLNQNKNFSQIHLAGNCKSSGIELYHACLMSLGFSV